MGSDSSLTQTPERLQKHSPSSSDAQLTVHSGPGACGGGAGGEPFPPFFLRFFLRPFLASVSENPNREAISPPTPTLRTALRDGLPRSARATLSKRSASMALNPSSSETNRSARNAPPGHILVAMDTGVYGRKLLFRRLGSARRGVLVVDRAHNASFG